MLRNTKGSGLGRCVLSVVEIETDSHDPKSCYYSPFKGLAQ
jgi:hypothetical protein